MTCGSKNASQPIRSSSSSSSSTAAHNGGGSGSTASGPPTSSTSTPAASTSSTSTKTKPGSHSTKPATGTTTSTTTNSPKTSGSPNPQPGGLSTAAKAGIGVGVGIGALIAFVVLLLILRKRQKRKAAERARATGGMSEKPSPWPSLRRLWRSEVSGQHDRPELEGSSGQRELAGNHQPMSRSGQIAELSAEQRALESNDGPKGAVISPNQQPAEMSATPGSPRGPLEPSVNAHSERVGRPEESEWNQSNPPPIPYASKPRPP